MATTYEPELQHLNFIFFVGENIHEGSLDTELPEVSLRVGDQVYQPDVSSGPRRAEHHRVTVYSFSKRDDEGNEIDIETPGSIRLYVSNRYLGSTEKLTFIGSWDAPYSLPEDLKSRTDISPVAVLALGAGLSSSVLTPCLLQLVVVFGSILGGFSSLPGDSASTSRHDAILRRKIVMIALAFVIGFTLFYKLAGALIGAIGHRAQLIFAAYSRTVAVVSGVIVILMGRGSVSGGIRNAACDVVSVNAMKIHTARDVGGAIVATLII